MQANLQADTTFTKIFVGGLPYHTTDETLRAFFSKFGDIEEAVVITDRNTKKSRGYGFVTMSRREEAEAAVKDPNPTIDGRRANVNLAYLGAKNRAATLPFSYSLLARMPTYQSTAAAYPSNVVYYPLTQQSTLQQPVFITSATNGTAAAWPTNIFSQYNLASLSAAATTSNTNLTATLTNPGTLSASQTIFDGTTALFDSTSAATGQQLHWPNYNQL
ncbi:unnamed protein product [Adineta ricciae]|uniref:RRM domain-containing protein n=1 Tax=Adineta ricciae TaxID=249248 RepID=A0A813QKC0_ADIRI|nr:unnamed protein product [Adineta ricciae]CAF1542006.1 unnamed protein product [Adineta ricciae]